MKKVRLFLILFSILLFYGINVSASEDVIPEDASGDYMNHLTLTGSGVSFNYLEAFNNSKTEESVKNIENLIQDYHLEEDYLEAKYTLTYFDENGEVAGSGFMKIAVSVTDYEFTDVALVFDGHVSIFSIQNGKMVLNTGVSSYDIHDFNESYALVRMSDTPEYHSNAGNNYGGSFETGFFYTAVYEYVEDGSFGVDVNDPLPLSDITKKVGLKDKAGITIADFSIDSTDYPEKPSLGDYYVKIRGFNKENIIIIKKINIHVLDMSDFITIENITTEFDSKLTEEDIKTHVKVSEDYEKKEIETDYFYGYKTVGVYSYTAYVTFENGVVCYKKGTITVTDTGSPYFIKSADIVYATTTTMLTKEDILSEFWVYDDYDGSITDDDITLDGYISYVVGYKNQGDFKITLKTSDKNNNSFEYEFIIRVGAAEEMKASIVSAPIPAYQNKKTEINPDQKEYQDPVVKTSDYIIQATTSRKLSVSEIQDLLIEEGYLGNLDTVNIESDYFDYSSPNPGNYTVTVSDLNGNITYYQLLVKESEEEEESSGSVPLWIWFTVGGVTILGLAIVLVMRFYVHAKKN